MHFEHLLDKPEFAAKRAPPRGCPSFYLAAAAVVIAAVVTAGVAVAAAAEQQDQDDDPPAAVIAIATKETVTHRNTSKMEFSSGFTAHSMVFPGAKNVRYSIPIPSHRASW